MASSEYNQRKKGLHAQLQSQIASLAERRPARYEMRMQSMQALEAVHPKLINDAKAMRHCSEAMHSAYLRRQACMCVCICTACMCVCICIYMYMLYVYVHGMYMHVHVDMHMHMQRDAAIACACTYAVCLHSALHLHLAILTMALLTMTVSTVPPPLPGGRAAPRRRACHAAIAHWLLPSAREHLANRAGARVALGIARRVARRVGRRHAGGGALLDGRPVCRGRRRALVAPPVPRRAWLQLARRA